MKMTRLAAYLLFLSVAYHPAIAAAQDGDVNKRYPWRVPEWLWDTDATAHLLTTEEVVSLRYDIAKLAALEKLPTSSAADALEEDIVKLLSSKFSSRDLAAGATLVKGEHSGIVMAVQIDPSFDPVAKNTIQQAISQLIDVILDPAVIKKAFELSTTTPSPMPEMFEGGKKKTDPLGRPIFTSAYAEYLKYRAGPTNPEQFSTHLRNALTDFSGDPTLLVISRYTGNVWWGGAWHRFFINPIQQLSRNSPSRGYFYIRLNSDRFVQTEAGWNDPAFWASKIAHELLHNLGYWHPNYENPAERDANNKDQNWSFLVSFETAILEKLKPPK